MFCCVICFLGSCSVKLKYNNLLLRLLTNHPLYTCKNKLRRQYQREFSLIEQQSNTLINHQFYKFNAK